MGAVAECGLPGAEAHGRATGDLRPGPTAWPGPGLAVLAVHQDTGVARAFFASTA